VARTQFFAHARRSLWLLALACASHASWGAVSEYDVKAALIYKISKFIRWPESAFAGSGGALRVCVVGRDDFGASIDSLNGQKVQGQLVQVERLPRPEQPMNACHIVFVGASERARLPSLLAALSAAPVLTISDIDGFAVQGGMVGFATHDGKLSFQINPAASARSGLEIGAQLLQLATLVGEPRSEGRPR
jgi:hypothetical protein